MPERIQLKRTKGWRMPDNTVKVDRTTKWGNPVRVGWQDMEIPYCGFDGFHARMHVSAQQAVEIFEAWHRNPERLIGVFPAPPDPSELRGKNLACWCKLGEPCHADVLLEIANG